MKGASLATENPTAANLGILMGGAGVLLGRVIEEGRADNFTREHYANILTFVDNGN